MMWVCRNMRAAVVSGVGRKASMHKICMQGVWLLFMMLVSGTKVYRLGGGFITWMSLR